MQFPESWLREFCNPPLSTRELADVLTMGGFEVEDLRPAAPPFSGVVVGHIRSVAPHPNADRLRVCEVDVGEAVLLRIVCGAPNAREGIRVPCARVGAELPPAADGQPFRIKLGQLRGIESQGMLCSSRELGLGDDHGGLLELEGDAPAGTDLREALHLDDTVFTLKLTPNLAHALSVYGVARELAALTGTPLRTPIITPVPVGNDARLPVRISAPDLCGRFSGRVIRGVNPQARTPAWMVQRLARCGQRSVTPLVDISNYVMFEYGRPTHIFDLDRIHGGLEVRWGREGESLKLLNGNTITVDASVGVIADDVQVESLAGIMGGDATAVSGTTRNIYVEAAFWWPQAVQGRSRRYNFTTDAGHRFERGVDPSLTVEHIERITRLVQDICGGEAGPMDDQVTGLPERNPVALRVARAQRVIGMPVDQAQCVQVFQRLGLPVSEAPGVLTVTPPAYRFDLAIEEDLIEEVARVVGYQRLPEVPPLAPLAPRVQPEALRTRAAIRRQLASLGYQETINFSFVESAWERDLAGNADPIRLLNPIASQMSVMRSSLMGSLLQVLRYNLDRHAEQVRVFEIGRVFRRDASVATTDATVRGIHQPLHVAGLAWGDPDGLPWDRRSRAVDFIDVKGDVESLLAPVSASFEPAEHPALHPGRSAAVKVAGESIGHLGELHPRWRQAWGLPQAPVLFELVLDAVLRRGIPLARPVPRFQQVTRDLAVIVAADLALDRVLASARSAPHEGLLRDVRLFDVYRPAEDQAGMAAGEKSLALRLTLGSDSATLTDAQIDAAVAAVIAQLTAQVGARLRH